MPATVAALKGLLPASQLATALEPYKRLLGVLVRQDCISLAVSNEYLSLAEPLGGLMLRDGRLSSRALQRMLAPHQPQLAGFLVGCEVALPEQAAAAGADPSRLAALVTSQPQSPLQLAAVQLAAVQQVQGALLGLSPQLPGGWAGSWCADVGGASCRIMPPSGLATAAAAAGAQGEQQLEQQQQQQQAGGGERCSLGQQFLQDWLDSLGALNTFG